MGAMTSTALTATVAANNTRRHQLARADMTIATAQKKASNIALARSQHETPISAPAPNAQARHFRLAANSSIHAAPRMIQLVGASAKGTVPYVASKGQRHAIPTAQ